MSDKVDSQKRDLWYSGRLCILFTNVGKLVGESSVPRNCKPPRSTGSEAEPYTLAAVDHYIGIYYETIDTKPAVLKTD